LVVVEDAGMDAPDKDCCCWPVDDVRGGMAFGDWKSVAGWKDRGFICGFAEEEEGIAMLLDEPLGVPVSFRERLRERNMPRQKARRRGYF
jgi:hypothetical protein